MIYLQSSNLDICEKQRGPGWQDGTEGHDERCSRFLKLRKGACEVSSLELQFCRGRRKIEKAGGRGCALRCQKSGGVDRLRRNFIGEKLALFPRLLLMLICLIQHLRIIVSIVHMILSFDLGCCNHPLLCPLHIFSFVLYRISST
jgi:hypothetical protein